MVTSFHAGYCGSHLPSLSSIVSFPAVSRCRMATDVNDFVMLPISKSSAGVTVAPAFGYLVVPAARLMFVSAPFRLMLRDAAEMCSAFARVAT
jgi:hypothetical protein